MKSLFLILLLCPAVVFAQKDLGNGFYDYGTTSNTAFNRGIVATIDGGGHNIILTWLFDHRGGYSLLFTDASTGKSEQFYPPFPVNKDAPYASLLSRSNKYYTLFNGYFSEFDPANKKFSFVEQTKPKAAMAMLEDKEGNIWAATYPNCGLVKFNPKTAKLTDYGFLYNQNWAQYPKYVAADEHGWIYVGIGTTLSQIVAFDTKTEKVKPLFTESERKAGTAYLYKGIDNNVYGRVLNTPEEILLLLENGNFSMSKNDQPKPQYFITGNQNLYHNTFPNGDEIKEFNLSKKQLTIFSKLTRETKTVNFDYETDGSWTLGVTSGPDKKLYGGVTFPMRMFCFNPKNRTFERINEHSQLNAMTSFNNKIFSGGYPQGDLIEYDPAKSLNIPFAKSVVSNPAYLFRCSPVINRPHRIAGLSDGNTVVLSGTPDYGHTGGGLLFWNIKEKTGTLLKHTDVIINQATMSIAELSKDLILGGTTVTAGTGGEVKANKAVLYMMDVKSKKIIWQDSLINNAKSYNDLCLSNAGIIYGFVNSYIFLHLIRKVKK